MALREGVQSRHSFAQTEGKEEVREDRLHLGVGQTGDVDALPAVGHREELEGEPN